MLLIAERRQLVPCFPGGRNYWPVSGRGVSTQQLALVELATRTKLYVDSLDAWLMEQPSLVNARKRAVLPALRERTQFADALARYLTQLGLERRQPPASGWRQGRE